MKTTTIDVAKAIAVEVAGFDFDTVISDLSQDDIKAIAKMMVEKKGIDSEKHQSSLAGLGCLLLLELIERFLSSQEKIAAALSSLALSDQVKNGGITFEEYRERMEDV